MSTTYISSKEIKGDLRLNTFYYLIAIFVHLSILIILNNIVIGKLTMTEGGKKEETLILIKTLPPAPETKIDTPKPISQVMARMGNVQNAGGGGGGRAYIDEKLIEEIKVDNSHKLKDMSLEDLQKILPEKGDEDLLHKPNAEDEFKVKEKEVKRTKTSLSAPVVKIGKGYRFGIKGGKGTIRSFESALRNGLFGKPTGIGDGIGSGTGPGYGPGSGGGWGGGHGGGIGSGVGSGWQGGGSYVGGEIDAVIKSERIIKTTVRVFVLLDGSVDRVDLLKSSGFVELDNLALENAKATNYEPLSLKPGDEEKMRIFDVEIEFSQIK